LLLPDFSSLIEKVLVIPTCTSDTGGSFSLDAKYIHLNRPPVAQSCGDKIVLLGEPVQFLGVGSYDPDGDRIFYSWDFSLSDGLQEDSTEISPNWTYYAIGDYTATLTVTDSFGAIGRVQMNVTVRTNSAPHANAGLDQFAGMGEVVLLN